MSNWEKVRLGNVVIFNPRESISKNQIAKKISMEKLKPFTKFIDKYEMSIFKGGTKFRNGDTLLSRITPCLENGKTSQVTILDENEVGFGSTEFIVLREKEGITDKDYIYYLSISPIFRNIAIQSMVGSSGRQRVQQDALENIEIFIPSLPEQKSIADTLSCFDNKIEINTRINKIIEEMAQTIFKSWFVDFEPFKDGEFEESELGSIPNGWRTGTLGELIYDTLGGDWGKEISKGKFVEEVTCIRGADIPKIASGNKGKPATRFILKKNLEKKQLSGGQIIIEISGGSPTQSTGRTALITEELVAIYDKPLICTNFCRALSLKKNSYSTFVYSMLQYLYKIDLFFQYENGTTGIKNLDTNNLFNKYQIVIPTDKIMGEYEEVFSTLIKSIYNNGSQSDKLSTIRDTILPKLISGEIRVPIEGVELNG
ncbi:restriction endonuclease subunit S [Clostridium frigoris]|uniref:Restriction endonuclease subunit S n=1 Tax=Clostridium frigoris TaxID=205327 RepID=A0ABS6BXL1_9CLOT|nr:restriction endonuclease subunit S [Clostridium frigoris]MBU3161345.1 restriction endonuclease subunit S [Clostridium frigoris]